METYSIEQLNFCYPEMVKPALKDIDITIEKGEFVLLFGQSGSGKTTLLKHLKPGLTPHGEQAGDIHFFGRPLASISQREHSRLIGYVMQDPETQIVTDKVWHELAFGLESLGYDSKTIRLRVAEIANFFNIHNHFHKKTHELSGGQKQLLNLASIMVMQPQVIILDEPTSQLDPIAATEFLETVKKINSELGITIVLSEHRLEEVFAYADRVLLMDAGKIIFNGKPDEVGGFIYRRKHPLVVAMPTPVRIFSELQNNHHKTSPTNIKQGRAWLSQLVGATDCQFLEENIAPYVQKPAQSAIKQVIKALTPHSDNKEKAAISVQEVWFKYDKTGPDIVRDFSLSIKSGEWFALLGGNGAGKTTAVKVIAGLQRHYRGNVMLFNKRLGNYKKTELHGNTVALLPQNPQTLFVGKTVKIDLETVIKKRRENKAQRAKAIEHVLKLTELSHLAERHPYDLSGGEQQRAALAKILLLNPKIIILDEPTKGLDGFYKLKLARILNGLKEKGTTILMVSHDLEFCATYADRCGLFFDGNLVSVDNTKDFFMDNAFYTTATNRMTRGILEGCVLPEETILKIQHSVTLRSDYHAKKCNA